MLYRAECYIAKNNAGIIYYYDKVIAKNLGEFLESYLNDERYFLD